MGPEISESEWDILISYSPFMYVTLKHGFSSVLLASTGVSLLQDC